MTAKKSWLNATRWCLNGLVTKVTTTLKKWQIKKIGETKNIRWKNQQGSVFIKSILWSFSCYLFWYWFKHYEIKLELKCNEITWQMSKHCWIIYWSYSYLAKLYIFYGFANISNGILTNWRKQKKKHFKYVSYGIHVNLLKALVKIISYLKEKSCSMILRRRKKKLWENVMPLIY